MDIDVVKEVREAAGLSQRQLAELASIDKAQLGHAERGAEGRVAAIAAAALKHELKQRVAESLEDGGPVDADAAVALRKIQVALAPEKATEDYRARKREAKRKVAARREALSA